MYAAQQMQSIADRGPPGAVLNVELCFDEGMFQIGELEPYAAMLESGSKWRGTSKKHRCDASGAISQAQRQRLGGWLSSQPPCRTGARYGANPLRKMLHRQ